MTKTFYVIDTMAMVFRSYHAFGPRGLTAPNGVSTSAVYGSYLFLQKLITERAPHYLVAASDCREKTFRHEMYASYKANRSAMPEDLAPQIPYVYKLLEAMGIPVLKQPGLEADDLIGSLVTQFKYQPDISFFLVSGDKDFMQLLDQNVSLLKPKKGGIFETVGIPELDAMYGCSPQEFVELLALLGDASDNVPGVPGIGEKGATKLINQYKSIENVYLNLDALANAKIRNSLAANRDLANLSLDLVKIKTDHPIAHSLDELAFSGNSGSPSQPLYELALELDFKSIVRRFEEAKRELIRDVPPEPPIEAYDDAPPYGNILSEEVSYKTVTDRLAFDQLLRELETASHFSVDCETTGLDVACDYPIGLSLSTNSNSAYYVPLLQEYLDATLTVTDIKNELNPLLSDPSKVKAGHNMKFDVAMLHNAGLDVSQPYFDTMVASYLVDPNTKGHSLDYCCLKWFRYQKIAIDKLLTNKKTGSMLDVPLPQLSQYACEDADFTFRLFLVLREQISQLGLTRVFEDIEMPLIPVLLEMEKTGVYIDTSFLEAMSQKLGTYADSLQKEIYELGQTEFNINSPKQLQHVLFEKLRLHEQAGLTRLKKSKTGYSTDSSVLELMQQFPFVQRVLEYRTITKLKNTYVDVLPKLIKKQTNRVHTQFHQTFAATGRLISSQPNLQNIPIRSTFGREIRKSFVPEREGYSIVSADYSQVELRLLAHLAQDDNLQTVFRNGEDVHTSTASKIFNVEESAVSRDQRSYAKAINFGIIYGMGPQKLSREINVTMPEAKNFISKYFSTFPQVKGFIESSVEFAKKNEYTQTLLGRRRPLPEIHSANKMVQAGARNIAVNSPVQGSAADLIKFAMIKTHNAIKQEQIDAKILLQVHDELVLECKNEDVDKLKSTLRQTMENALELDVPLKIDIGIGSNWLEAH
ncbi:MAG: DNA polymerase I [Oligoflexales bacterium]